MERKDRFEISARYYFQAWCPYCGVNFDERTYETVDDVNEEIFNYVRKDMYVCMDCEEQLKEEE